MTTRMFYFLVLFSTLQPQISMGIRIRRSEPVQTDLNGTSSKSVPLFGPWPGQENQVPFMSQWGVWSDLQQRQGIGQQPVQVPGIQLNPSQAQWFPNSPEYHGFDPNRIRLLQQQQSQNLIPAVASNNMTGSGAIHWPQNVVTTTLQPSYQTQLPNWGTWSRIQNKGAQAGILKQWVNWYQNPDQAAQEVEYLSEKQRQTGRFPDGRPIPQESFNYPDDSDKILVDVLAGFVAGSTPKKAAMHNMRTYYTQYRRYYWVGKRFYKLDPQSELESYHTCEYSLPPDVNIVYEVDNSRVEEIVFQCVKYQEICCKLNCCDTKGRPLYYSSFFGASLPGFSISRLIVFFSGLCAFLLYLY